MEEKIKKIIEELKPKIKKRAVFRFSDQIKKQGDKIVLADTMINLRPPVITIFTKAIDSHIKARLREIITHELIHTYTADEKIAYRKQGELNFFK